MILQPSGRTCGAILYAVESPGRQLPVPSQDGFWADDLRHFCQGFADQSVAYLGQRDALVVRQAGPTFELFSEAILPGFLRRRTELANRPGKSAHGSVRVDC
jgi:hypothetical protein